MKYFTIALVASILGSALSASIEDRSTSGGRLLDLLNAAFSYLAKISEINDPIPLEEFDHQHVKGPQPELDLTVTLLNNQIAGISNLILDNVDTDDDALTAKFSLTNLQTEVLSKQYEINGTALDHKISANGVLSLKLFNVSSIFEVQLAEDADTKAVWISSLTENFDIGSMDVDLGDVQVEGMTPEQVENFVENEALQYLKMGKGPIEVLTACMLQTFVNEYIEGMTIEQLTLWLKENTPNLSTLDNIISELKISSILERM